MIDIRCRQQISASQLSQAFRVDLIVLKIESTLLNRIISGAFRTEQITAVPPVVEIILKVLALGKLRRYDLTETVFIFQGIIIGISVQALKSMI